MLIREIIIQNFIQFKFVWFCFDAPLGLIKTQSSLHTIHHNLELSFVSVLVETKTYSLLFRVLEALV